MALNFNVIFSGHIKRNFFYYDKGQEGKVYSTNPSNSIINDFIPYHALMSGTLLSIGEDKALLYNLDFNDKLEKIIKSYENFFDYLVGGAIWTKLQKKNTVLDYRCRAGQLVCLSNGIVTPLMTLVVNKEHLFSIDKANPNLSKFFIVISREFSDSEQHSNLYKGFCKYYLEAAIPYTEVIYTKSIINFCYKEVPIVLNKPKTIAESREIYRDMTYEILRSINYSEYT